MSSYDIYVFLLCLIVFALLTGLFSFLIFKLIKLTVRLVRSGAEDEYIKTEYADMQKRKNGCIPVILDRAVSIVLCFVLFAVFAFSMYVNFSGACISDTIPTLSVVKSNSMAKKHEKNVYLFQNNLNDQFSTFDIILTYKLPPEDELELYDVVLYEIEGTPVIHRIVGIEMPNEKHDEYYFLLQGDAIENPDRFPVYYSQMRGIYRGQHIPMIGSFVAFMQSVAGYLCIILIVFGIVAIPLVEKKVNVAKYERLVALGVIASDEEALQSKRKKRRTKDAVNEGGENREPPEEWEIIVSEKPGTSVSEEAEASANEEAEKAVAEEATV